jgi:hypothetical protein
MVLNISSLCLTLANPIFTLRTLIADIRNTEQYAFSV